MKTKTNEYHSFAEWREKNFPKLERDSELNDLKHDSGQLGAMLANESIDRVIKHIKPNN